MASQVSTRLRTVRNYCQAREITPRASGLLPMNETPLPTVDIEQQCFPWHGDPMAPS